MNQIFSALSTGYTSKQVLDFLLRKFPQHSSKIKSALASGYTVDQIVKFLGGGREGLNEKNHPTTEHEATREKDIRRRENVNKGALAAGGLATSGLAASSLASPMAATALQRAIPSNLQPLIPSLIETSQSQTPAITGPSQPPQLTFTPKTPQAQPQQPNIPQSPAPIQPKGINTGIIKNVLANRNIIDNLLSAGNGPDEIEAYLRKFSPQTIKTIEKEGKAPFKDIVAQYAQEQRSTGKEDSSSLESGLPDMTSAISTPDDLSRLQQERDLSKTSTAAFSSEMEATRANMPSTLTGPNTTSMGSISPTSNRIIRHDIKDVNELVTQAKKDKPILDNLFTKLKKEIPGISKIESRIKDKDKVLAKMKQKGEAESISDYLAGRIVFDDNESLEKVKKKLNDLGVIEEDNFLSGREDGYRALHYQVNMGNGLSAEVQLMPKEINDVFDQAHNIYDKWKRKDVGPVKEVMNDAHKMKKLFDDAWDKYEERNEGSKQTPIAKKDMVASPHGVGEVREIRNGQAIVEVDGKLHKVKEEELIQSPLPEKDLADLFDDLVSGIEKKTGKQVSRNVEWAGYDPKTNELIYKPHSGDKGYTFDDISKEDKDLLTSFLTQRKSTGKNFIGAWEAGTESPIGAAMYQLIRKLQQERGGKGNEYRNRFETIYDALEPAKLASKEKHAERKKKAKKSRTA